MQKHWIFVIIESRQTAFGEGPALMQDYLSLVKQHAKEDYTVLVIDNSDIAKPASRKMEALSEIRDGSTGELLCK